MYTHGPIKTAATLWFVAAMSGGCTLQAAKDDLSSSSIFSGLSSLSWLTTEQTPTTEQNATEATAPAPLAVTPSTSSAAVNVEENLASVKPPAQPMPELSLAQPVGAPVRPRGLQAAVPNLQSGKPVRAGEQALPTHEDVWVRVRSGLRIGGVIREEVVPHLVWLRKNPRYFEKISARATPYLHYIVAQVEQRQMPGEMALVPIVESAFQPFAYSSSGAAGLWQIIPSTGRHLGLKQNWWYDGRRDLVQSTDVALNYLQHLYDQFDDWALAFAAYNCGEGTVSRAQARNRAQGKGTDYWSIRPLLPRETRGYVPRLLAIAAAARNPAQFDVSLPPIANEPYFSIVKLNSQVDLGLAAKIMGVDLKTLQKLNPGFKRWATDPDGPHRLLVPAQLAKRLRTGLGKIPPSQRVTWRDHRIQQGETLGQIARRYGTRVDVLKKVNKFDDSRIRAGRTLVVPVGSRLMESPALAGSPKALPRPAPAAKVAASKPASKARPPAGARWHVVRSGDSLWSIARHYDTHVATIVKANPFDRSVVLRPGQQVLVPVAGSNGGNTVRVNSTVERRVYTVRSGDSLWSIARSAGVRVQQIKSWNALENSPYLQPGQRLYLSAPSLSERRSS
jgi:membrane-bound lytic murein transglycosylase D